MKITKDLITDLKFSNIRKITEEMNSENGYDIMIKNKYNKNTFIRFNVNSSTKVIPKEWKMSRFKTNKDYVFGKGGFTRGIFVLEETKRRIRNIMPTDKAKFVTLICSNNFK